MARCTCEVLWNVCPLSIDADDKIVNYVINFLKQTFQF